MPVTLPSWSAVPSYSSFHGTSARRGVRQSGARCGLRSTSSRAICSRGQLLGTDDDCHRSRFERGRHPTCAPTTPGWFRCIRPVRSTSPEHQSTHGLQYHAEVVNAAVATAQSIAGSVPLQRWWCMHHPSSSWRTLLQLPSLRRFSARRGVHFTGACLKLRRDPWRCVLLLRLSWCTFLELQYFTLRLARRAATGFQAHRAR